MLLNQYGNPLHQDVPMVSPAFAMGGGQQTRDGTGSSVLDGHSAGYLQRPSQSWGRWRYKLLDEDRLESLTFEQLMEVILGISPDADMALWNLNLFVNPYFWFEYEKKDARSEAVVQEMLDRLTTYWGGLDVIVSQMVASLFLFGGVLSELVLSRDGMHPAFIIVQDPATVRFEKEYDEYSGAYVWAYGQYINGRFVSMREDPTISYLGLHPLPGPPLGRPIIGSALSIILHIIGFIRDLRRVIANQGYPRLDISMNLERLQNLYQQLKAESPEMASFGEWAAAQKNNIIELYAALKPHQAFVHSDDVTVNPHPGALNAQSLGMLEGIMDVLQRQAANGLKSNSLLQNFSSSSNWGDQQSVIKWEVYTEGVGSIQETIIYPLSSHFNYGLRVEGIDNRVILRFGEVNESQAYRRAETRQIEIDNVLKQKEADLIDDTEANQLLEGTRNDSSFISRRRLWRNLFKPAQPLPFSTENFATG